jgi:hypothetical protein
VCTDYLIEQPLSARKRPEVVQNSPFSGGLARGWPRAKANKSSLFILIGQLDNWTTYILNSAHFATYSSPTGRLAFTPPWLAGQLSSACSVRSWLVRCCRSWPASALAVAWRPRFLRDYETGRREREVNLIRESVTVSVPCWRIFTDRFPWELIGQAD